MTASPTQMDKPRPAFPLWGALVPAALLAVVSGFFAYGLTRDPSELPSTMIDRSMPEFALEPLTPGARVLANEDLKGKVSLINVFGSWCIACVAEHPMLMDLAEADVVNLYGVDWRDNPGAGQAWLDRYGNPYSITGLDADSRLAIDLGVTGAPETFIVDSDARIRYKHIGPITPEIWSETLRPIIRELEAQIPGAEAG